MFRPKAVFVSSLVTVGLGVLAMGSVVGCAPKAAPPAPPTPAVPAAFQVAKLAINPAEVNPGEKAAITAEVTNTGGTEGSYTAELELNGVIEATQKVTMAAEASQSLSFIVSRDTPGTYKVSLGKLTGEFIVVKPASPTPPPPVLAPPKPTVHTLTLTDAASTRLLYKALSKGSVHFRPGDKVELTYSPFFRKRFSVGVSEGKLWLGGVPNWILSWVGRIHAYTSYSESKLFLTELPPWFDPTEEIAPDITKLPVFESITTEEGKATITYVWP